MKTQAGQGASLGQVQAAQAAALAAAAAAQSSANAAATSATNASGSATTASGAASSAAGSATAASSSAAASVGSATAAAGSQAAAATSAGNASTSAAAAAASAAAAAAAVARVQGAVSRALNTIYQVSTTRDAFVSYTDQMVTTATIAGGAQGSIVLEISSSASMAGAQTVATFTNGQSFSLAVAIQGVQTLAACLAGFVPAGWYVRRRTVITTGTPTFSAIGGQETLL